jgi:hypothetical protein
MDRAPRIRRHGSRSNAAADAVVANRLEPEGIPVPIGAESSSWLDGTVHCDVDARQDVEAWLCRELADGGYHRSDEVTASAKAEGHQLPPAAPDTKESLREQTRRRIRPRWLLAVSIEAGICLRAGL